MKHRKTLLWLGAALANICVCQAQEPESKDVQTLRLVQDDAQDYMVSKIYHLKHVQANDAAPFLISIVKRYNVNSTVGDIGYGAENSQMLAVTCPVKMMPYVDDFVKKIDKDIKPADKVFGNIIKGSGITRAVYRPKYRSGQNLLDILVNAAVGEGPYGSVYAWDKNSNQIYWKDNAANTDYTLQFLSWIDRPAPQITFTFQIYEVRESDLKDIGIEYLAWKNGPGLNLFQTAFQSFSVSSSGTNAINSLSGPVGGFLFAPQFDASFIRILCQTGNAELKNTASLTVVNSDSASSEIFFNPEQQNIIKSNNDQTSVTVSGMNQVYLKITAPIVNLHYKDGEVFSLKPYTPGAYDNMPGTVFFEYNIQTANAVERNNSGAELIETGLITGNTLIPLNNEVILAKWEKQQTVEQTIGVPFLSSIPVLKYLFGTTTTATENTHIYLTVTAAALPHASANDLPESGKLITVKGK